MKILIDNNHSFAYAPGGIQTFIENTIINLREKGLDAENLRFWDSSQVGDIIHFFYNPSDEYKKILKGNTKIVINLLLGSLSSLDSYKIIFRKYIYSFLRYYAKGFSNKLGLNIGNFADAVIFHSMCDKKYGEKLFKIPSKKTFLIYPGVRDEYLVYKSRKNLNRKKHLITLSTIYEVKNSVYLANLAHSTGIPIVFLGKPFNYNSEYFKKFLTLVDDKNVIYYGDPTTEEKSKLLFEAKGFILLSNYESGPNVIQEASACGCPLILSDKKWAKENYEGYASFITINNNKVAGKQLLKIYEQLDSQKIFPVKSWPEVAEELLNIYNFVLNSN
jgi:glycosyltransferase involved in cell wall biosynthesis